MGDFRWFWLVLGGFAWLWLISGCSSFSMYPLWLNAETHSGPWQTSFFFAKKVNDWKLLTIFWKCSILDAWLYMTSEFTKSSTSALITLSHLKFVALTTKYSFTYESISAVRVLWWLNASAMAWLTMPTFSLNSLAIFRRRVQVCFNDKRIW